MSFARRVRLDNLLRSRQPWLNLARFAGMSLLSGLLGFGTQQASAAVQILQPGQSSAIAANGEDLQLKIRAIRTLSQDPELAGMCLGVTVQARVATVWGLARNRAQAQRALEQVGQVIGIASVVDQIRNETEPVPIAPLRLQSVRHPLAEPLATTPPCVRSTLVHRPDENLLNRETWQQQAVDQEVFQPNSTNAVLAWLPANRSAVSTELQWRGRTASIRSSPPTFASTPDWWRGTISPQELLSLDARVNAVRSQEDPFRSVGMRIQGSTLYLQAAENQLERLFSLAHKLARVDGVGKVVVAPTLSPFPLQRAP